MARNDDELGFNPYYAGRVTLPAVRTDPVREVVAAIEASLPADMLRRVRVVIDGPTGAGWRTFSGQGATLDVALTDLLRTVTEPDTQCSVCGFERSTHDVEVEARLIKPHTFRGKT